MKKKTLYRLSEAAAILLTCAALLISVCFAGSALTPERKDFGAVWDAYLSEQKNSLDVLFFGSSIAYCDVIPAEIYARTGLTSFVMAGPEQTAPIMYYYLRECLKTQSPQCVYVEVSCAFYPAAMNYSLVNLCYMPWSVNRLLATLECEREVLPSALFPLKDFHYRVYEPADERALQESALLCGYTYLADARVDTERENRFLSSLCGSDTYKHNLEYLRRFAELCEEQQISLYFYIAPTTSPIPEEQKTGLLSDLAQLPCTAVLDLSNLQIGIDDSADWYDSLHFNYSGALKFSAYLSEQLDCFEPMQKEVTSLWQERIDFLRDKQGIR